MIYTHNVKVKCCVCGKKGVHQDYALHQYYVKRVIREGERTQYKHLCDRCCKEYGDVDVPEYIPREQHIRYRIRKIIKDRTALPQNKNKGVI